MTTGLKVIKSISMTDAMLVGTNVPETDHPVYSAATTYANNFDLGIAGQRGIDIINDRLSHYTSPLCYPQMPA